MSRTRALLLLLLTALLVSSCSSSTIIRSEPSGAKLYLNEQYRGHTPYVYSDTKIVGSSTRIKLTHDGYEDFETVLTRDERLDVGALVGGVLFVFPFLWVMEYDPMHTYEMQPIRTAELPHILLDIPDASPPEALRTAIIF